MSAAEDAVLQRWLSALNAFQPGLPQPVATAMVEGTAKGPSGRLLEQIEEALINLESAPLENLTGSEARVTIAILHEMNQQVAQLLVKLSSLWEQP